MIRAIRRFVSTLHGRTRVFFFLAIMGVCVVALLMGVYISFYYKYNETDPLMLGINVGSEKSAQELATLEDEFNSLFENKLKSNGAPSVDLDKLEETKDLVYTGYKLDNTDENYYAVNAQIPIINIDTEKARELNQEIRGTFYEKANEVMRIGSDYTQYNVTYQAYLNNDVISVVIKSTLKQGNNPEKVSVKTCNYNIPGKKQLTFLDVIELKKTTQAEVQSSINKKVKEADTRSKIIAAEYGTMYERDLSDDMYKVQNTANFFLTDEGNVYIVYAYGNNTYTNEMDVIVF